MRRARPFPWQPDVRASDREREQVAEFLSQHCAEGRLTAEELADRTDAAYRAVWRSELAELQRDLPSSPSAGPARTVRTRRRGAWHSGAVACVLMVLVFLALAVSALPAAAWLLLVALAVPFLLLGVPMLMIAFAMLAPVALVGLGIVWAARALVRPRQERPRWIPPARR